MKSWERAGERHKAVQPRKVLLRSQMWCSKDLDTAEQ